MRSDDNLQETSGPEICYVAEIVIADTSPLNYLVLIDCQSLLPILYGKILAPPAVIVELVRDTSPRQVVSWASQLPDWLEVVAPKTPPDAKLRRLGAGERDAIQLALEMQSPPTLLIDERTGRNVARIRGLSVTGTLGVLIEAKEAGLVDGYEQWDRLNRLTTFRSTPQLREEYFAALGILDTA